MATAQTIVAAIAPALGGLLHHRHALRWFRLGQPAMRPKLLFVLRT